MLPVDGPDAAPSVDPTCAARRDTMSDTVPNPAVVALVKASAAIPNPSTDSKNGAFRRPDGQPHRYASLNAFLDAIKPVLAKHDLALFQPVSTNPQTGMIEVQTMFMHISGSQVAFPPLAMPMSPNMTCQQAGTSISYMRRYSLQSALGLAADDNDAEDDRKAHQSAGAGKPQGAVRAAPAPDGGQMDGTTAGKPLGAAKTAPKPEGAAGSGKPSEAASAPVAAPVAIPVPADGVRDVVGRITYVKVTEGTGRNGKPYRKARIGLKPTDTMMWGDEVIYCNTFDQSLTAVVEAAKEAGEEMRLGLRAGQYGEDLVDAHAANRNVEEGVDEIPF